MISNTLIKKPTPADDARALSPEKSQSELELETETAEMATQEDTFGSNAEESDSGSSRDEKHQLEVLPLPAHVILSSFLLSFSHSYVCLLASSVSICFVVVSACKRLGKISTSCEPKPGRHY